MFRRPLRPLRREMRRAMVQYSAENEIARAHRLLEEGQPGQAAAIFSQLATGLSGRARPRQAGNLHAKAAHAFIDAGDARQALEQARLALGLFKHFGLLLPRAAQFKTRVIEHMRAKGMTAEADALDKEYHLPMVPVQQTTGQRQQARLPAAYPKCGAPVRYDEVEWIDALSAECGYYSATLQTEG